MYIDNSLARAFTLKNYEFTTSSSEASARLSTILSSQERELNLNNDTGSALQRGLPKCSCRGSRTSECCVDNFFAFGEFMRVNMMLRFLISPDEYTK